MESTKNHLCVDARRDEVYAQKWEATNGLWQPLGPVHAEVITTESWSSWSQDSVVVLGECVDKVRELHKSPGWSYGKFISQRFQYFVGRDSTRGRC